MGIDIKFFACWLGLVGFSLGLFPARFCLKCTPFAACRVAGTRESGKSCLSVAPESLHKREHAEVCKYCGFRGTAEMVTGMGAAAALSDRQEACFSSNSRAVGPQLHAFLQTQDEHF